MFKWFRRQEPPQDDERESSKAPAVPARKERPASRPPKPPQTLPDALPEVIAEGNTQADWSMWEDSMTALDSQMQGLPPDSRIQVRDTRPSQLGELDPFSGVRNKRKR